ncbi:hypothetical protein MCEREM30_03407 [Paracoccaceae bacterium]
MLEDRIYTVRRIIADYVRSPSLRHMRDFQNLEKVSKEIVTALDRDYGIWRKWDGTKDQVAKLSLGSWVPISDLAEFLNTLPGPKLSKTDVKQRILALEEEESMYPQDDFRDECEALYRKEAGEGTDLIATLMAIRRLLEDLHSQRYADQRRKQKEARELVKLESEQRLLSGADCPWTSLGTNKTAYCRVNGRTYRLLLQADKRVELTRVRNVDDAEAGVSLGLYRDRGTVTAAVKKMAFEVEPRSWG